jgi:hypothetical protein
MFLTVIRLSLRATLSANGLPESFPALIEVGNNFYYMAGDFGKCQRSLRFSRIMVINKLIEAMKSNSKNPSNFFYTFYQPFMEEILEDTKKVKAAN